MQALLQRGAGHIRRFQTLVWETQASAIRRGGGALPQQFVLGQF